MLTLDTFQKTMESIAAKFKVDMQDLLLKGITAGLDEEIMLIIVNREMEKLNK